MKESSNSKKQKIQNILQFSKKKIIGFIEKFTVDGYKNFTETWTKIFAEKVEEFEKLKASSSPMKLKKLKSTVGKNISKENGSEIESENSASSLGIGLGFALRSSRTPVNALTLLNPNRKTIISRACLPPPPPPPTSDKENLNDNQSKSNSSSKSKNEPGGSSNFHHKPSMNGDVPDKSIREIASNVNFLISQSRALQSAKVIIWILIFTHFLLILFCIYLFYEVSSLRTLMAQHKIE